MSDKTDTSGANSHVREMSVTERLRALLDERGVEWWQSVNMLGCVFTRWYSPLFSDEVVAMENGDGELELFSHLMTPEQAVAATLGRGTCKVECFDDGVDEGMDGEWYFETPTWYLSCGHEVCGSTRPRYCSTCGRKVV